MNIIKTNRRALQSGTTLVEMSVVIAVILLLVGVLFIAVDGWRNAANRSACIVNLATLQKAVRSFQNANIDSTTIVGYDLGALKAAEYFGPAATGRAPVCPTQPKTSPAAYVEWTGHATAFPPTGTVAFTCPAPGSHAPASHANW
jgi:type II secretory pathway pseudopilin PulG